MPQLLNAVAVFAEDLNLVPRKLSVALVLGEPSALLASVGTPQCAIHMYSRCTLMQIK